MAFNRKRIECILRDFKLLKNITDEDLKKDELTIYTEEGMIKIKELKKL